MDSCYQRFHLTNWGHYYEVSLSREEFVRIVPLFGAAQRIANSESNNRAFFVPASSPSPSCVLYHHHHHHTVSYRIVSLRYIYQILGWAHTKGAFSQYCSVSCVCFFLPAWTYHIISYHIVLWRGRSSNCYRVGFRAIPLGPRRSNCLSTSRRLLT